MNSGRTVDWKTYIEEYIRFIKIHDIKNFIELDLYTLKDIGIKKTLMITEYIENKVGKQSIPVFHQCMGINLYRELCKKYDYVAIGASGITNECKWTKDEKILKQMVNIAKSYGTRIHGLGYTRLKNINTNGVGFDSVDSSSWIGSRFNRRYDIVNGQLCAERIVKSADYKIKDYKKG